MAKAGPKERMRYWFDRTMSKGTKALIGWLAFLTLVLVAVVTVLVWFITPGDVNDQFNRVVWESVLGALDPGYIDGINGSPAYHALMFILSLGLSYAQNSVAPDAVMSVVDVWWVQGILFFGALFLADVGVDATSIKTAKAQSDIAIANTPPTPKTEGV